MSRELNVTDDIRSVVQDVIKKYNLDEKADVVYGVGSEAGFGYLSTTLTADITDDKESLNLFLKYGYNIPLGYIPLDKIYDNEIYFYDCLLPEFRAFEEDKNVKDLFKNVPKCYATSAKKVLALENLKTKGFELHDKKKSMNKNHIVAVFKAYAKYHGICFAFKAQKKEKYQEIISDIHGDIFNNMQENAHIRRLQKQMLEKFSKMLDPVQDKHILDVCENLFQKFLSYSEDYGNFKDDYSVIIKGDCCTNNTMFRYEGEDKIDTAEVMLIDWQFIKEGSVTLDLSYFFYSVAAVEDIKKLEYYMHVYHTELSNCINELGSNAEILYPYSVFQTEWKKHSTFGYSMALLIFHATLQDREEIPKTVDDSKDENKASEFMGKPKYFRRLKDLTEHFIENDFI